MQRINRVLKALFAFPFTWGVLAALLVAEWGFLWWFEPPLPMTLLVVVLGVVLLVIWPVLFLRSEMFQRLYSQMPYETEIDNLEEILASCPEAFKAPALHTVTLVDQVRQEFEHNPFEQDLDGILLNLVNLGKNHLQLHSRSQTFGTVQQKQEMELLLQKQVEAVEASLNSLQAFSGNLTLLEVDPAAGEGMGSELAIINEELQKAVREV